MTSSHRSKELAKIEMYGNLSDEDIAKLRETT
jgi:hypothetical protein